MEMILPQKLAIQNLNRWAMVELQDFKLDHLKPPHIKVLRRRTKASNNNQKGQEPMTSMTTRAKIPKIAFTHTTTKAVSKREIAALFAAGNGCARDQEPIDTMFGENNLSSSMRGDLSTLVSGCSLVHCQMSCFKSREQQNLYHLSNTNLTNTTGL